MALPTETVYGLAGDATSQAACHAIFRAKGRPSRNPLIAHLHSLEAARRCAIFSENAERLARAFWPGPLTLVLPIRESGTICPAARAGLATVALRVPGHPLMRDIARACARPLAAPSANLSGRVSATTAGDVIAELGRDIALIIDDGPSPIGLESSIISILDEDHIILLRPGAIPRTDIARAARCTVQLPAGIRETELPTSPGQERSHYAPRARVRTNALSAGDGEAFLAFGTTQEWQIRTACAVRNLSPAGDLAEAATQLFALLRALDATSPSAIAVMPIPRHGLGEAINDRLERAAAPRPA